MNVGIIGAGGIATSMARTLNGMSDCNLYAISARDLKRAEAFKETYGAEVAYGSYEEMLKDEKVDLVYIATPHSHHFEHMKLCIQYHKPILCEKSFTVNADQARLIRDLAAKEKVFVTEALWPRYMPSLPIIRKVLSEKPVGEISFVTCNLSYDIDGNERIVKPELAGGALLDVGIYGLNFLVMTLGKDIKCTSSMVELTDTGVDGRETITFVYENGVMATTTHGIYGRSDRKAIFTCEKGYIIVENINNPQCINIFNDNDELVRHIDFPEQITGYEYEVAECKKCLEEGKLESDSMPLSETVFLMEQMDALRDEWGIKYPFE